MTAVPTHKPQPASGTKGAQRTWRKKTPVEIFRDQEQKLRQAVSIKEEELAEAKRLLQKFEQARKIFETN